MKTSPGLASEAATPERPPEQERPPLILAQGEQRLIRIIGLERYSLGGSAVRALHLPKTFGQSASLTKEALLLKGVSSGRSDLWVWKADGSSEHRAIRVEKTTQADLPRSLERALGSLQEVEIVYSGATVVLRGKILSIPESARVTNLLRTYPKEIHNETELSDPLASVGQARLDAWIKELGRSAGFRVERVGSDVWLRGNLERSTERASIEKQARSLFPPVLLDLEAIPDSAPTVHFKVFLLELKRNKFHTFGMAWPSAVEGAFRVTTSGIQDLLSLDLALQALEGEGAARILSNPELVVRAPGKAELFAGGEMPIRTRTSHSSNVTWKPYGLSLHLNVTHTTAEKVRLDISTEVSHLDTASTLDHIPGIQTNRMKTQVDARYGVPLLLSGLLKHGMREQAQGLPLLRNIPILGPLFGSEDYLNERSELVAILLPSGAPPPNPMNRAKRYFPKGSLPIPRSWVSPNEERELRESPDFPWNVLQ